MVALLCDRGGVLLDVDGVLLNSIPAYRQAWGAWADEYGIGRDALWATAHGRRPVDIIHLNAPQVNEHAALQRFEELIGTEYERYQRWLAHVICCNRSRQCGRW